MEIIILSAIVIIGAIYYIMGRRKDVPESVVKTEQSTPEPVVVKEEVKPAEPVAPTTPTFVPPVTTEVKEAIKEVVSALDANGDGKVNLADVKVAGKKAVTKAKTAVTKAKKKK